jgi:hypothetical protein
MIRTWIAIDIKLERYGSFESDGQDVWNHPAFYRNKLGNRVAVIQNNDPHAYNGQTPGFLYEKGYIASRFGDGAMGMWEIKMDFIDIEGNSLTQEEISAAYISNEDGIMTQAPTEAHSMLMGYFGDRHGGVTDYGAREQGVYATTALIDKVLITARLVNYASQVHRIGYKTIQFVDSNWSPNCLGVDTGNGIFINCEASACGNVDCASQLFGPKNKLLEDDPVYKETRQVLWEGQVSYQWETDPYLAEEKIMGRVFNCNFYFDLITAMGAWVIPINIDSYTEL